MYGKCLYCGREAKLYPVPLWDNPEHIDFYCSTHHLYAKSFNQKQKKEFIEHFKDPELRKRWLSKKQQDLYNRVSKEQ